MKSIIFVFSTLLLFSSSSFAAYTITAPTQVDVQHNVEETVSVTITSDAVDTMRKIRLIGLTSSDSQTCVKEFSASEDCTFSVSKTTTKKVSARIYLYPKNSSRAVHTIQFDIATSSTNNDLTSGISFINNNQTVTSLDLGSITLSSIAGTRVHVQNTGNQKTSAIESMSSNYTGSAAITLARDTCQSKELNPGERCYFDVRLLPTNGIDGVNAGTFSVKANGQAGSDLSITVNLTVPVVGGGSGEGNENVDYFCTQAGVDESGFTSPTFCTASGAPVELQYIASCFINPTWCTLNTNSENSVVATTGGDILGFRYHGIKNTSLGGGTITSEVRVTFVEKITGGDGNPASNDLSPLYTTNVFGTNDFGYRPQLNTLAITGPIQRSSFRVHFKKRTASDGVIIAALDAETSDSYNAGTRSFNLDEGDLLMTDSQLYTKYEDNILACFAAGGDILKIEKTQERPRGDLGSAVPHGTPVTTVFSGICGHDGYTGSGSIEANYETHGFYMTGISNDFSFQQVFGVLRGSYTYLEDFYPQAYSIPYIIDYGTNSFESGELKYIETELAIE